MELNPIFKALQDQTRRILLETLLEKDGQTLFELHMRLSQIDGVHLSRQALTRHLNVLEKAGLIRTEFDWRSKHHFLQTNPLAHLHDRWLSRFLESDNTLPRTKKQAKTDANYRDINSG